MLDMCNAVLYDASINSLAHRRRPCDRGLCGHRGSTPPTIGRSRIR